jgi:hypothetical protein
MVKQNFWSRSMNISGWSAILSERNGLMSHGSGDLSTSTIRSIP